MHFDFGQKHICPYFGISNKYNLFNISLCKTENTIIKLQENACLLHFLVVELHRIESFDCEILKITY